jgi:hypothetical protein
MVKDNALIDANLSPEIVATILGPLIDISPNNVWLTWTVKSRDLDKGSVWVSGKRSAPGAIPGRLRLFNPAVLSRFWPLVVKASVLVNLSNLNRVTRLTRRALSTTLTNKGSPVLHALHRAHGVSTVTLTNPDKLVID